MADTPVPISAPASNATGTEAKPQRTRLGGWQRKLRGAEARINELTRLRRDAERERDRYQQESDSLAIQLAEINATNLVLAAEAAHWKGVIRKLMGGEIPRDFMRQAERIVIH